MSKAGAIGGCVALIAIFALVGTPEGSSARFNLAWSEAFGQAFWSGALYPRHLPALWEGLGGLDFFFYGPMPFWIEALFGWLLCPGCNVGGRFAATGGLMFAASGMTFYLFAKQSFSNRAAIAGATVYVLAPYHLQIEWVVRQAAGEVAAYVFLPLIALGARTLGKRSGGILLAISWACLLLSHLPLAMLAVHVFPAIALAVFLTQTRADAVGAIGRMLGYGAAGTALAAIYWVPALILLPDVSAHMLYTPYFEAHRWLLFDGIAEPNAALMDLLLIFAVVASVLIAFAAWVGRGTDGLTAQWSLAPALGAMFLMTVLSLPLWQSWILDMVQFPWRAMFFIDFAAALAVAALVARASQAMGVLALVAALAGNILVLPQSMKLINTPDRSAVTEMTGAAEYAPPDLLKAVGMGGSTSHREAELAILQAARQASAGGSAAGDLAYRQASAIAQVGASVNVLPLPYWRHWRLHSPPGGTVRADPKTGFATVSGIKSGQQIILTLPWHWSEWLGAFLSLGAMLVLLGFFGTTRRDHTPK